MGKAYTVGDLIVRRIDSGVGMQHQTGKVVTVFPSGSIEVEWHECEWRKSCKLTHGRGRANFFRRVKDPIDKMISAVLGLISHRKGGNSTL